MVNVIVVGFLSLNRSQRFVSPTGVVHCLSSRWKITGGCGLNCLAFLVLISVLGTIEICKAQTTLLGVWFVKQSDINRLAFK